MQDGGALRQGTILAYSENSGNRQLSLYTGLFSASSASVGWLYVIWDNGNENIYRMGAQECYDLQLLTGNFYE